MPTTTLVPTALTDSNSNVASGAYTDIDETIASADAALLTTKTNDFTGGIGTGGAFSFTMSDMPAAADSINTVKFRVRAKCNGTWSDDIYNIRFDVSGTNAPSTTAEWTGAGDAGGSLENRGASTPVTSSASVTDVNGWVVRCYQTNWKQVDTADGLSISVDCIEIIVDYNEAAPSGPAPGPTGGGYTVIPTTDTSIYGLCITQARDFVILGGMSTDRYLIRWSAIGDETDWPTPATDDARSKQSGSQQFPTKYGWVTGLAGDDFSMLVFQENAIWEANYVGGDIVWSFRLLSEDIGCVRQGRLLKVHDFVVFQSNNGYHVISQGQINNIGFGKVDDSYN